MSQSIVVSLNNEVITPSREVGKLLATFLTVENPLASTLDFALNQKAKVSSDEGAPELPLRDFYVDAFSQKNSEDIFSVVITSEKEILKGSATRAILSAKMRVAVNRKDYMTTIERETLKVSEGTKKSARANVANVY